MFYAPSNNGRTQELVRGNDGGYRGPSLFLSCGMFEKKKKNIPAFCAGTIAGLDNTSPIVSVMFCLSREGLSAAVFVFVKSIFCRWFVWFFGLCGSETAGI